MAAKKTAWYQHKTDKARIFHVEIGSQNELTIKASGEFTKISKPKVKKKTEEELIAGTNQPELIEG